jgi:hypothetical protein
MSTKPMFTPNGDGYDITAPGVLLICANVIYGDPDETTAQGRTKAMAVIDGVLNAAYRGGFFQGDVLRTLLARNQPNARTVSLAQAACDAAGPEAISRVFSLAKL